MGSRIASIFLRQTSRTGSFITVCFINMLLNFRWSIPAWLMLAAYLIFGVPPLWVFWVALSLWPLAAILMTAIVRLLRMLVSMSGGVSSGHSGGTVVHVDGGRSRLVRRANAIRGNPERNVRRRAATLARTAAGFLPGSGRSRLVRRI